MAVPAHTVIMAMQGHGSGDARGDVIGRACCVIVPLLFGVLSLWLGQDANWDLRNYHWYNPYALLSGRFGLDVAPAQTSTFYNPLLDVPFFLLANALPARLTGFVLGALHGANFVLLYALARTFRLKWAAAVAALGVIGGGHLGLVGTTFQDNVASLFVLGATLLLARAAERPTVRVATTSLIAAGALTGAIVGLKLPTAVYGVGLAAACLVLPWRCTDRIAGLLLFGVSSVTALLATGGYWMARLWSAFGNPIYPYFNDVIGSSMALSASYRDQRFIPTSIGEAFVFPFFSGLRPLEVGEIAFTDFRLALLYIALLSTAALAATRFRIALSGPGRVVVALVCVSYAAWLGIFAIYRYVVATEMLAPLVLAVVVAGAPLRDRAKTVLLAAAGAFLLVTTHGGTWGRVPWGTSFVEVDAPSVPPSAMVLMAGTAPLSWVVPAFTPDVPAVRLSGFSHHPSDGDVGLVKAARERVSAHAGPLYLIYAEAEESSAFEIAGLYGLAVDRAGCAALKGNLDPALRICGAHRNVGGP